MAAPRFRKGIRLLKTEVRSLVAVRDKLLALPHPYTRDAVEAAVSGLDLTRNEIEPYLNFSASGYTRTLFYRGPRFEILVLCWKDGQCSPIHDHAASICSMAVVEGVATTENYRIRDGRAACAISPGEHIPLAMTDAEVGRTGHVVTVIGGDIHRVRNLQGDGSDLITIHFYLPPIPSMRCFDPETGCCDIQESLTLPPRL